MLVAEVVAVVVLGVMLVERVMVSMMVLLILGYLHAISGVTLAPVDHALLSLVPIVIVHVECVTCLVYRRP